MAGIKKSELRLLAVFGGLVIAVITFFVLDIVKKKEIAAIARQDAAQAKITEYKTLIQQKDRWETLRSFVRRYQPVYTTEEEKAPELESYFRSHADAEGVTVTALLPKEPEKLGSDMMSLSLEAKVTGSGTDVLRFLTTLQAENKFYAIRSATLSADRKDPTIVKLDMIFSRWYTLEGEVPSAEAPEAADPGTVASKEEENQTNPNQ